MKLEKQVCTPEQAKRLNELGVLQKSLFYYHPNFERPVFGETVTTETGKQYKKVQVCNDKRSASSAFTAGELGVMLPAGYDTMYTYEGWRCYDCDGQDIYEVSYGYRYEAECRAAAIIFLLENGKLKPEEINERLKSA